MSMTLDLLQPRIDPLLVQFRLWTNISFPQQRLSSLLLLFS